MQKIKHARFRQLHNCGIDYCCCGRYPHPLSVQGCFAKKLTRRENADDRFFAASGDNRNLHLACLDVENVFGWIALRKNGGAALVFYDTAVWTGGRQKGVDIKGRICCRS